MKFTLSSRTIKEASTLADEQVFNGYGCTGENISPDLEWSNPPNGTKSYALIMHDPDATNQKVWYHWIVINIPTTVSGFVKGERIAAPVLEFQTSFGISGYGGPCPPVGHGKHRYIFTVYALSVTEIAVTSEFTPEQIEKLITPYILDKVSITAFYERK